MKSHNLLERFPIQQIKPPTKPYNPRTVSRSYLRELTYVLLSSSLLRVVDELAKGFVEKDGIYEIKLKYEKQKQLSRRIQKLREEMDEFCVLNGDVVHRVHKQKNELFKILMEEIQGKNVDLTTLSMYILLLRFQINEREKPLHKDFAWLSDKDSQILAIIDIISSSEDGREIEPLMYEIADKVTKRL